MAFGVFKDSTSGIHFVVVVITSFLSAIAGGLRFLATRRSGRKPGFEDWLAASAIAVFMARAFMTMYGIIIINDGGGLFMDDRKIYEKSLQIVFASSLMTLLDQTLSKLSICALYYRIFAINKTYRFWVYGLASLQCLTYVAFVITQLRMCRPINKYWQLWAEGECFEFSIILVAMETPNSLIDFALVGLALVMIRTLNVAKHVKWKLRILFGLGSLAGIIGFIKIGVSYKRSSMHSFTSLGIWAAVQSFVTIICCCAPMYKSMFPAAGTWHRLVSKVSNINLGRRSAGIRSAGRQEASVETGLEQSRSGHVNWLRPDVSSTKGLAWAGRRASSSASDGAEAETEAYPIGSIKVHHRVEVV